MESGALKLSRVVRNMIKYPSIGINQEEGRMGTCDNLILTGWGYAEYVASAAVALKALGGRADVYGVSRNTVRKYL